MRISSSKYWKIIYIYTIPGIISHNGFVKIGETSIVADSFEKISKELIYQTAKKRIKEQTSTAGIDAKIEYATLAIKTSENKETVFSDKDFHNFLFSNNCKISRPNHLNKNIIEEEKIIKSTGSEWFKLSVEQAIEWLEEYKSGKKNISFNKEKIILREPQKEASKKIQEAFNKVREKEFSTQNEDCFLLDAIMRFGKCITSYDFINKCDIKKTIILTHKPVVKQSWNEDFLNYFKNKNDHETYIKNYKFLTKNNIEKNVLSEDNLIYFASLQDMRSVQYEEDESGNPIFNEDGSKQIKLDDDLIPIFKDSNKEIFNNNWDLVIIDEAHEGNKTTLAETMHKHLKRKFTLYLSGTTFNIRYDSDFDKKFGKNIYVFDQESESICKENWEKTHGTDHNPYAILPKICLNGVSISKDNLNYGETQTGYKNNYFDFRLFFELDERDEFVNKEKIIEWLDNITSEDIEDEFLNKLPFNKLNRFSTQHSLWILPKDGTKIAKKLEETLKKHDFFKKRGYEIFNVSGNSWNNKTLDKLIECTNDEKKCSITLSVDRLTTGVTIKGWSAVLMLNNGKSPMKYFQTIYRAKSPSPSDWIQQKENALIFDFNPDRMLTLVFEAIKKNTKKDEPSDKEIKKVLNFYNVMCFVDNDFVEVDAAKLKSSIDRAIIYEIVENGFKSNSLLDQKNIEKEFKSLGKDGLEKFLEKLNEKISKVEKNSTIKNVTEHGLDKKIVIASENEDGSDTLENIDKKVSETKELEKIKNKIKVLINNFLTKVPYMLIGKIDEILLEYPNGLNNFTVDNFCQLYDSNEWSEVMQKIEKKEFKESLEKFVKREIFNRSCQEFISRIMEIEKMKNPLEKKEKWIELFETLQNPDSETVLTPWKLIVEQYKMAKIDWQDAFTNKKKFIDINSKSSLYPLFAACELYEQSKKSGLIENWNKIIYNQIYVICRTNLSRNIAIKILGFDRGTKNVIAIDIPSLFDNKNE